jgi:Protein of unknown function (DUF2442)
MLKPAKLITTDAQITKAIHRARKFARDERSVVNVGYSHHTDRFTLCMSDGAIHIIPRRLLQGLECASRKQLSHIEIIDLGEGLYWPELDMAHLVSGVLSGVYGSEKWMRQLEHEIGRDKISA